MKKLMFLFVIATLFVSCHITPDDSLLAKGDHSFLEVVVEEKSGLLFEAYDSYQITYPDLYQGNALLMKTFIPLDKGGPIVREIVGFWKEDNIPENIQEEKYIISYQKVYPLHWLQEEK
jgi:hypothetical protein